MDTSRKTYDTAVSYLEELLERQPTPQEVNEFIEDLEGSIEVVEE